MNEPMIISNARVLDVDAGTYLDNRFVEISNGRIASIGDSRPRTDAREFNVGGRTLMPGLCDAHVHVTAVTADLGAVNRMSPFYVAQHARKIMEDMLMRGFTTVRDAGGADFGLARAVDEGLIKGPRLLFCGHSLSQTGGHGDIRGPGDMHFNECLCCAGLSAICDGVAEMRKACREEIRKGANQIKIMVSGGVASPTDRIDSTQFAFEEIQAAVQEAHAANIPVMAHAYTAKAINRALMCGVDSIEHGNLLDMSAIRHFKQYDAFLVPTLITYRALAEEGVASGLPQKMVPKISEVVDAGINALRMAHEAGVKIVYGTDLLGSMHRRQLEEFVIRSAVQAPIDIIRSATTTAAALFRMQEQIGRVAPGYMADLLVVDGDPISDVQVLTRPEENLRAIIKDGAFVKNTVSSSELRSSI
ncbi:imidazolonepropionase-like amidohydrolase [Rhizobium sp. BK376]|nr:imidazolonepropionase-like amidohydrolase [Rhizobium sp. BK376]